MKPLVSVSPGLAAFTCLILSPKNQSVVASKKIKMAAAVKCSGGLCGFHMETGERHFFQFNTSRRKDLISVSRVSFQSRGAEYRAYLSIL